MYQVGPLNTEVPNKHYPVGKNDKQEHYGTFVGWIDFAWNCPSSKLLDSRTWIENGL